MKEFEGYEEVMAMAREAFDEAMTMAWKIHDEAITSANAAMAMAREAFDEAMTMAWKIHDEVEANAERNLHNAEVVAGGAYDKAVAPYQHAYNEQMAAIVKAYGMGVEHRVAKGG